VAGVPTGDDEVEQAPHGTRPRPAPLPSLLSFLFSFSTPFSLAQERRRGGQWLVFRPATSRWSTADSKPTVISSSCLLFFLSLSLSLASGKVQSRENCAMVAAREVAAPPLYPSPTRAFTLG
jgi:hypothetical protein